MWPKKSYAPCVTTHKAFQTLQNINKVLLEEASTNPVQLSFLGPFVVTLKAEFFNRELPLNKYFYLMQTASLERFEHFPLFVHSQQELEHFILIEKKRFPD